MVNTSLTVQHGYPNGHKKHWNWLTDELIKYISNKTNDTIFLLWGRHAYNKKVLIDTTKHKIIASSHPSGFSVDNKMGDQPSFITQNHFGKANKLLKKCKKDMVIWDI
jgi:uracil-DNA glycosylase